MAGAAACLQFMQSGLMVHAFGAYLAVLSEAFGWSRSALAGAAAMKATETAVLGPALGWIIDRYGAQWLIRGGIIVFGIGFILLSTVDTLLGFYAAFFVVALGSTMCGFFALQLSVIHWFEQHRARALSVVSMGMAVGGLSVPAVAWTMQTYGWRTAALASGILIIVVGTPIARIFRHRPPAEPPPQAAAAHGTDSHAAAAPSASASFSAREAVRTRTFWLLGIGHGAALLVVTAVNVHAINHMRESLGYSVAQASLIIMAVTVFQIVGLLLSGLLGDRVNKRYLCVLCMVMHASGLLCLTYAGGQAMLLAFALLHGMAWGMRGPLMQALRADYFGRRAIGLILGLSALITVLGQIGGPIIAGLLADLTGDYRTGFVVLASAAALGSGMFAMATRPPQPVARTLPTAA